MEKLKIYRQVFNTIEDRNLALWCVYKEKNKITERIKKDFNDFCMVMRNTFEENPANFSFQKVYALLPENKWVSVHKKYIEHISKTC